MQGHMSSGGFRPPSDTDPLPTLPTDPLPTWQDAPFVFLPLGRQGSRVAYFLKESSSLSESLNKYSGWGRGTKRGGPAALLLGSCPAGWSSEKEWGCFRQSRRSDFTGPCNPRLRRVVLSFLNCGVWRRILTGPDATQWISRFREASSHCDSPCR